MILYFYRGVKCTGIHYEEMVENMMMMKNISIIGMIVWKIYNHFGNTLSLVMHFEYWYFSA